MKTLIVSLTSQYIHSSLAPWYLFYSAKENCLADIEVSVFEGTVNEDINDLYNKIVENKADLIAFSCYIWNIEYVLELAKRLKCNGSKILLGGPEVSYNAQKLLKEHSFLDYILCGEGEMPFVSLLNTLYSGGDLKLVPGLCFNSGCSLHISEPYKTEDIPISPYKEEYLNALNGRIAYIETSRGCPFSCAFCLSGRLAGVRFFSLERAKNDILILANSGSKIIKFVDRTFNANPKRAFEIWKFIIDSYGKEIPSDVCFHFEIAGDILTDEDFKLLKTAPKGAIQFEIGIQSFNPKTLEAINRKTNVERLKNNIKSLCSIGNIHIHIDLIAGLPFEDLTTFKNSFNLAFSLNADMLQLGFLKLLHGADMREQADKYPCKFSKKPPYEVNSTPWINGSDIDLLKFTENALERFVNSGRFPRTNKLIFENANIDPFNVLTELGKFTGTKSMPLSSYVDLIYEFFGANKYQLRDALISDIATSVKSTTFPKSIIIPDKKLKKLKNYLEKNPKTCRKKGVMRNVFILYGENVGGYVDYDKKTNGKYILKKLDLGLLED